MSYSQDSRFLVVGSHYLLYELRYSFVACTTHKEPHILQLLQPPRTWICVPVLSRALMPNLSELHLRLDIVLS